MIAIDNALISDSVIEEQFVCDLNKCKGGCCEDGDAGAPLETEELAYLTEFYETIKAYMTPEGIKETEKVGKYIYDQEFGWVTPTINSKVCAYGYRDQVGIIKCAIEQAYNDDKISWKKPISCHLYPIRVTTKKNFEALNYHKWHICSPACSLGKELQVPVYKFLKDPLIRKYGAEWYSELEKTFEEQPKALKKV